MLLYGATAAVLAVLGRRWLRGRCLSWSAVAILSLLPLAFTVSGFLPGRTLAPTPQLAGVPPWADPELVAASAASSSAVNPLLLDPLSQMLPWSRAARDSWLFNSSQGAGAALLGNGQSAVLFPTELASRGLPPFRSLPYSQAARLLIAGWGLFLLARRLGAREPAALVGAAVYVGSGFLQLWRLHPHSLVAAMAPWIAVAALDLLRRRTTESVRRSAARLAVCGALGVFAGHPETLLHGVLLAGLLALLLGRWRQRVLPRLRWVAAAGLLAFLLAAPVLLPVVENLRASAEWSEARAERRAQTGVRWVDSLDRLAPAVAFAAWGDPRDGSWHGPENLAEVGGGSLGASAVLLALFGVWRYRRRRVVWALLGVGLLSLAAGALVPLVAEPLGWIPLLRDSLLKRLALGWCLAGTVLAALGVEGWVRSRYGRRTAVAVFTAILAVFLGALLSGGALALELVPLIVLAAVLCWNPRGRLRRVALALLLATVLVPRLAHFARWVPVADASAFFPETLATRCVAERLEGTVWRVAGLDAALVPQAASFFGFEEVRANDPMTFGPYAAFSRAFGTPRRGNWVKILDPDHPALDFLGVRYLFDHPSMHHRAGVEVVYQGRDAVVYENPGALPRMFLPREVLGLANPRVAMEAAVSLEDFAARAVVAVPPERELPVVTPNGRGRLADLQVEKGVLGARVVAEEPLLVVTSQPAIPGWRLTVDGRRLEPERVNGAFLGVRLAAGEHTVEFRYRPLSWVIGCWAFGVGILAWFWFTLIGRHDHHRRSVSTA